MRPAATAAMANCILCDDHGPRLAPIHRDCECDCLLSGIRMARVSRPRWYVWHAHSRGQGPRAPSPCTATLTSHKLSASSSLSTTADGATVRRQCKFSQTRGVRAAASVPKRTPRTVLEHDGRSGASSTTGSQVHHHWDDHVFCVSVLASYSSGRSLVGERNLASLLKLGRVLCARPSAHRPARSARTRQRLCMDIWNASQVARSSARTEISREGAVVDVHPSSSRSDALRAYAHRPSVRSLAKEGRRGVVWVRGQVARALLAAYLDLIRDGDAVEHQRAQHPQLLGRVVQQRVVGLIHLVGDVAGTEFLDRLEHLI